MDARPEERVVASSRPSDWAARLAGEQRDALLFHTRQELWPIDGYAEDLVQELLLDLFAGRFDHKEVPFGKALAFGKAVLTRRVGDLIKKVAAGSLEERYVPRVPADAWKWAQRVRMRTDLAQALKRLSKPLRRAFLLRERRGWTTAEVADREGVSQAAIRQRIARAKKQLSEDETLGRHSGTSE